MYNREQLQAWKQLEQHFYRQSSFSLQQDFQDDPDRAERFAFSAAGIFADFSKALITDPTLSLLLTLADQCGLTEKIAALKNGEAVNQTENRPALHYLLRAEPSDVPGNLQAEFAAVEQTKQRIKTISTNILDGTYRSFTDEAFTDIVHIGIGGSYLGPAMMVEALKPYQSVGIRCHFVSNICANNVGDLLPTLNPATTLFIVASKTFTTLETFQNAEKAKIWLEESLSVEKNVIAKHFFAVTAAPEKALAWGFTDANILPFWEWVGGRYSAFSSIGLVLAIGVGYDNFEKVLAGARTMDQHFFNTDHDQNIPVIMAMIGIWYVNFYHRDTLCIAPYDHRLRSLPAFLQQLEMESNGKSVTNKGESIDYPTCPTIFGEAGTNCQHSYFQLLHQSPDFIPVDFIVCFDQPHGDKDAHPWLVANALAQSQALMMGQQRDESDPLAAHKKMQGNRPSATLALDALTPESLGTLIALYEHKVFVQGVIWDVDSFDQWGVELGKTISKSIHAALTDDALAKTMDSSTQQMMVRFNQATSV